MENMTPEFKEELKSIIAEALKEENIVATQERKVYRQKVDDLLLVIKGDAELGVRGLVEEVRCVTAFKDELKLVRWVKSTGLYVIVAMIIAYLGIQIYAYFE